MSKKLTIGKKNVSVTGRFLLKVNADAKKFRITNINSFVPQGKTVEDKQLFLTAAGLVDALIIDKLSVLFDPDRNDIDAHNVGVLIQHPDVKIIGFNDEDHKELVRQNLKKSNPRFTITNVDKLEDEKFTEEVKLINLRAKLFSETNPLSKEMLVWLASNFGIAYKSEITDPVRYRQFIVKRIDSYIQANADNRDKFVSAIDNMKMTEMVYYVNEFKELGIVSEQSGIFKIGDRPIGASLGKIIDYFEQNPDVFNIHKEQVIEASTGKIYS